MGSLYGPLTNYELEKVKTELDVCGFGGLEDSTVRDIADHRLKEMDRNSVGEDRFANSSFKGKITKALSEVIADRKFMEASKELLG